jgi:hypothetical protein
MEKFPTGRMEKGTTGTRRMGKDQEETFMTNCKRHG